MHRKRTGLFVLLALILMVGGALGQANEAKAYSQYGCWNSGGNYCTAATFTASQLGCNPSCNSIYARQTYPTRSCRWRVYYRIPGSGNDWHTDGVLMNPSGWYDLGGNFRNYDSYGWPSIGTHVSNASSYDVQVQCGASWADYAWAYLAVQVNSP